MNQPLNSPNFDPNKNPKKEGNWLNLSLGSAIEKITGKLGKEPVPETALALHDREVMDATIFAKTAASIDSEKFTRPEFLLLIKIKYCLANGIEDYAGLNKSVKYLQAAIGAKNSYLTLDQTELRYRSSKQQDFYQYISNLMKEGGDREIFRKNIHDKLLETLPTVKTEEGKIALQAYEREINKLAEYELGLKLFSLFKTYQLADYSILKNISDLVANLKEKDTTNFKALTLLVIDKFNTFESLGKIIGLSPQQNNPETYARMLQYIALDFRNKKSYDQFKELLLVMKKWLKPYQGAMKIRQDYPAGQYKLPKEFTETIPGEGLYTKYKSSLTDKRTGHSYIEI